MKKAALVVALLATASLACTSNQKAGAAQGATRGAVGGAAAGAVSALIFGGDVGEAAARGAVWAGTAGAVGGAMAGTDQDRREAQQAQAEAERELMKLRQRIGDDAFDGLGALAECKHDVALAYARSSARSDNADYTLAAVWLEVFVYLDTDRGGEAEALYPQLVERDERTTSLEQAGSQAREALELVRDFREKHGQPRLCK